MKQDNNNLPIRLEKTYFKAVVEYDGTNYLGFQRQIASQVTVQGEIERALAKIVCESTTIVGSGRTDTGVHASGQVIGFWLRWRHGCDALQKALNSVLARDIAILQLTEASPEFHPRFSARQRQYEYTIYNSKIRSPLNRTRCWHVRKPLDIESMNQAAATLIGKHDFATFGQPPQGTNTVREIFHAQWRQDGAYLMLDIGATAFLRRMVRSIAGTLKQVGDGSWSAEMFAEAFAAADRQRAGVTAPPQGLVFKKVLYD